MDKFHDLRRVKYPGLLLSLSHPLVELDPPLDACPAVGVGRLPRWAAQPQHAFIVPWGYGDATRHDIGLATCSSRKTRLGTKTMTAILVPSSGAMMASRTTPESKDLPVPARASILCTELLLNLMVWRTRFWSAES